jgi:hypothetical protein
MNQPPHPDTLTDYRALKAIHRGGTQSADDKAMEAMWQAIERGESKEEAETIFSETYQKGLHGK